MTANRSEASVLSRWGALYSAVLCGIFGANTVAIKMSLSGVGVFTAAGIRFTMAAVLIMVWAFCTGQKLLVDRKRAFQLAIISLIFVVQLSLFYKGLSLTHASRGALLANMQPFFVLFLAHFFIAGDRMNRSKVTGMVLAFCGVAFVFLQKSGTASNLRVGDSIILLAAFVWACNGVYTKKILVGLEPFLIVLYQTLLAGPLFLLEAALWDPQMVIHIDWRIIVALIYQGLITTAFGFIAWNTMLRRYGAVALHSFIFIMPITGVLLGGMILKEPITSNIGIAMVLVAAGIMVVNYKPRRETTMVYPGRNV